MLSCSLQCLLRGLGSNPTAAIEFSLYKTKGAFLRRFKIGHLYITDNIAIPFKSIIFCKTVGGQTDSNHGLFRQLPIALHLSYMALLAVIRFRSWVSAATTKGPNQYTIHAEGLLYDPGRKHY